MQVIGRKKCALTNLYFPLDSVCSTWATSRAKKKMKVKTAVPLGATGG